MCKSKKAMYLFDRARLEPVQGCMCLVRIHLNAAISDNEPQERDSWYMKFTLLQLHKEVVS